MRFLMTYDDFVDYELTPLKSVNKDFTTTTITTGASTTINVQPAESMEYFETNFTIYPTGATFDD